MICKYTQQSPVHNGHGDTCWKALLANANVGGENVHRGAILGAILGARVGDENLPNELKSGLYNMESIAEEIDSFVNAVMQKSKTSEGNCVREDL